ILVATHQKTSIPIDANINKEPLCGHRTIKAKGWNYHQGPEWLWITGYFLRAYFHFDTQVGRGKNDPNETVHAITRHLLPHRSIIETSPWAGLPELTNKDGAECPFACPTQAWSSATLLDLFDDIRKLEISMTT
ncbi:16676_t:CDS:2, partial [Acaulospora colombiana]